MTAKTLYDEMGNRGSLGTLQKYLMQWLRQEVGELPEPPDNITLAVKKVWQSIERKAQATLNEAQACHTRELQALQEENKTVSANRATATIA